MLQLIMHMKVGCWHTYTAGNLQLDDGLCNCTTLWNLDHDLFHHNI